MMDGRLKMLPQRIEIHTCTWHRLVVVDMSIVATEAKTLNGSDVRCLAVGWTRQATFASRPPFILANSTAWKNTEQLVNSMIQIKLVCATTSKIYIYVSVYIEYRFHLFAEGRLICVLCNYRTHILLEILLFGIRLYAFSAFIILTILQHVFVNYFRADYGRFLVILLTRPIARPANCIVNYMTGSSMQQNVSFNLVWQTITLLNLESFETSCTLFITSVFLVSLIVLFWVRNQFRCMCTCERMHVQIQHSNKTVRFIVTNWLVIVRLYIQPLSNSPNVTYLG